VQILSIPEALVQEVRSTVSEYKAAQEARNGNLPTVQPSLHMWPGETCHMELAATYINTDTKTYPRRVGKLWITNSRLVFVSPERDFEVDWSRVKTIARDGNTLHLEMSIKRGNGFYIVDRPLLAEAVISRLVEVSRNEGRRRATKKQQDQKASSQTAPSTAVHVAKSAYQILDLLPGADADSIRIAYRRMAKLYHPDKVANLAPEFRQLAELKMKEINTAYQELVR
jgi:hypothetical protein